MSTGTPLLSILNLSFRYPEYPGLATRSLFSDLNLELPRGCTGLLLAKPDFGKTTLCRILAGLVPRFSGGELEGRILLGALELLHQRPYELLEEVGLVFQNPGEQLFLSRCDSEVAFALESLAVSREDIEKRIRNALAELGLEAYRRRNPHTLSGGEKKKLLIACILAVDPRLWLLDETLEELDADTKDKLMALLGRRNRTALILSAKWHDLFRNRVSDIFLLEDVGINKIRQKPGSRGFHELLVEKGFVLPEEKLKKPSQETEPHGVEPILEATDIEFHYETGGQGEGRPFRLAVEELRLYPGRTAALVGGNGSGKSTLARILCGLLSPRRGSIRIREGKELGPADRAVLHRFTGYLFQDPDLQIFLPTIFEELSLGLRQMALDAEEIKRRVERAAGLFHLPDTETPPSLMSYGARKRLQAAVYYLLDRPLVIIDEGDSGLGVIDFAEMVRIFQKPDCSLLFITHDQRLADALADRVLYLSEGRLV